MNEHYAEHTISSYLNSRNIPRTASIISALDSSVIVIQKMIEFNERLCFTFLTIDEVQSTENIKKQNCLHLILDQAFDYRQVIRRIRALHNDTVTESLEASLSASGAQISF